MVFKAMGVDGIFRGMSLGKRKENQRQPRDIKKVRKEEELGKETKKELVR